MSRRYGRNQRRAARQALAEAMRATETAQASARMDRALLNDLSYRLAQARDEIDRARRIAGEMSVLFPASKMAVHGAARQQAMLRSIPPAPVSAGYASYEMAPMARDIPLPLLVQRVDADHLQQAVHARVLFGDGQWRYGVSMESLQSMPAADLVEQLTHELGRTMARDLQAALKK